MIPYQPRSALWSGLVLYGPNKEKKTVTIFFDHAYLQAIEIDPNNIIIDEVKEGLLARGDIELTVRDYNVIA